VISANVVSNVAAAVQAAAGATGVARLAPTV